MLFSFQHRGAAMERNFKPLARLAVGGLLLVGSLPRLAFSEEAEYMALRDVISMANQKRARGVDLIAMFDGEFHQIASKRPIARVEDFKDLRLATTSNMSANRSRHVDKDATSTPFWIDFENPVGSFFMRLGARVTEIPRNETKYYTVDAVDASLTDILEEGLFETFPFVTMTNHVYAPRFLVANLKRFGSLSSEIQGALRKAASDAQSISIEVGEIMDRVRLEQMLLVGQKRGVQVLTLGDVERDRLSGQTGESYDRFTSDNDGGFVALTSILSGREPSGAKYKLEPPARASCLFWVLGLRC